MPSELETIDELSSLLAGEPDVFEELAEPCIEIEAIPASAPTR